VVQECVLQCPNFETVEIGPEVLWIDTSAFAYRVTLTEVTLSVGLVGIADFAFQGCTALTEISLPSGLTDIAEAAFAYSGLTRIIIPATTRLHSRALSYIPDLAAILVFAGNSRYKGVNGILYDAMETELLKFPPAKLEQSFSVPEGVTAIGESAFEQSLWLEEIELPSSLRSIKEAAFSYSENLTKVTLAEGLVEVGALAFAYCENLESLYLPDTVYVIGSNFLLEAKILWVPIPATATTVSPSAFESSTIYEFLNLRGIPGSSVCAAIQNVDTTITLTGYIPPWGTICDGIPVTLVGTATVGRSQPVTATPLPTTTPRATRTLLATPEPDAPVFSVNVGQGPVFVEDIPSGQRIQLSGLGTFNPVDSFAAPVELRVSAVSITPSSMIFASRLTIEAELVLGNGSVLTTEDTIGLVNGVRIVLEAETAEGLPVIDLGLIGNPYHVVPGEILINITSVPSGDFKFEKRVLIGGQTLSNCADWLTRVTGLPEVFILSCGEIPIESESPGNGARLLAGPDVIGLWVEKKVDTVPDDGFPWLYIGVGVGAVVVIVAIVIVVLVIRGKKTRRKRRGSNSYSCSSTY
jgi:hypothetical protein